MKLIDLITVTGADEVIHVVTQTKSLYMGTVRNAYNELDESFLKESAVNFICTSCNLLLIEVAA